jgi:GNAT superfamily N-acetyltransferase
VKLVRIGREDRPRFQERLTRFDAHWTYPYGEDRFRLDHGDDYYAFFDRLGEVNAFAFLDGEDIIGMGVAVLREVPFRSGGPKRSAWYLCDAKVHPDHRGQNLSLRAVGQQFLRHYLRCGSAYGISMNPGDGSENGVVRHAMRNRMYKLARFDIGGILALYSLDADAMRRLEPLVIRHRGPSSYLSLEGKKDLVMESTRARLPLLHVQFGPCAEPGVPEPLEGHTHMFAALVDDPLSHALEAEGVAPSATATIVAHRMRKCDWQFVLTSDI